MYARSAKEQHSMAQPKTALSCLFFYKKRVLTKDKDGRTVLATRKDGSVVENPNYISFLQVISTYWEIVDEETGKAQLNIFLNGGSVSRDRDTGATQMKAGFTVVLPQFQGEAFMDQFYNWSCAFGLSAQAPHGQVNLRNTERREPSQPRNAGRVVNDLEFAPLDDESQAAAYFEPVAE
jgi:hypothetical protein